MSSSRGIATAAKAHCRKAMKFGISRGFNSSKCKTAAKLAVARIKLLRNKRQVVVRQMRRDIAMLLESGQDSTARIRVEHVMREQNILAANEFIELFCELIVARLSIIAKQRECPADLKEGISSLIFAAPRCSEIPELLALRYIFEKKYGKDFVGAATDLRPSCGVNRMLIDKLSVRTPAGEVKLKVMKDIAKEYQVEWDTTETETELLKPPEELIEGPNVFVSASSLPVKSMPNQSVQQNKPPTRYSDHGEKNNMHYEDTISAAEAAAESAKRAIAAAEVAAYLAAKASNQATHGSSFHNDSSNNFDSASGNLHGKFVSTTMGMKRQSSVKSDFSASGERSPPNINTRTFYRRHSYNVPPAHSDMNCDELDGDEEFETYFHTSGMDHPPPKQTMGIDGDRKMYRRHTYNAPSAHSDFKFDESDCDEEIEMEELPPNGIHLPPNRPAPQAPSSLHAKQGHLVHPNLPDYEALAARFEALKHHKSQP